jgi:hypothetical protein
MNVEVTKLEDLTPEQEDFILESGIEELKEKKWKNTQQLTA